MIRYARIEDLDDILRLLDQLSPADKTDRSEFVFRMLINNGHYVIALYEDGNKVIGTATLMVRINLSHDCRPVGYIENVVVDDSYRGQGIGKKLVENLLDKADALDCYKVILDCSKHNIKFYEKVGFSVTDEVNMRVDL